MPDWDLYQAKSGRAVYVNVGDLAAMANSGSIFGYGTADLARLTFVKTCQRLGFSLDESTEMLRLENGTRCR